MTDDDVVAIRDHDGMVDYGRKFAKDLRAGDVVLLHGDLGTGKTTLTQGIAAGLHVGEVIQSPTFAIVAVHDGTDAEGAPICLYHLDLYRLATREELDGVGYEQYLEPVDGISVIEWPERAGACLPDRFWLLRIEYSPAGGRTVRREWHVQRSQSS